MTAFPSAAAGGPSRIPTQRSVLAVAAFATLAYFVMVGGTAWGEVDPALRLLNGSISALVIGAVVLRRPRRADRVDVAAIAAACLFALSGVFSAYPRQSLDAVLAALGYAAVLYIARDLFAEERARKLFVVVLVALSVVVTLITARYWLIGVIEWWARTDWQVTPPLTFELGAYPWGHRHDLVLLIALLYPAWWIGRPSAWRQAGAISFGIVGLMIVLVGASRTVWAALALATIAVVLARVPIARLVRGRIGLFSVLGLALAAAAMLATGVGESVVQRALNLATLDWRFAMWGPLTRAWLADPLTGAGPASFPWLLQGTAYFDTNSWTPRHPDSAVVQLVAETGLLGVAAVTILLAAVVPAVARGRSTAAQWALTVFGLASLAANPTDFAFLVATALVWIAYAAPHSAVLEPSGDAPRAGRPRPVQVAVLGCLAVVGLAYGMTAAAAFAYERARSAVTLLDVSEARVQLDAAVALDPGMALYRRQRGTLALVNGDPAAAAADLEVAVQMNPSDDLAWRTLAVAHDATGERTRRDASVDEAIALQRSDPTNLLLRAAWASDEEGRAARAFSDLAEVVQAWPLTVFSRSWPDSLPASVATDAVVHEALDRWRRGASMPNPPLDQGVWLAAMAGRDDLEPGEIRSPFSDTMSSFIEASIRCDPSTDDHVADAPAADRRSTFYWLLRVRASIRAGDADRDAARMAGLLGSGLDPESTDAVLNPLNENAAYSVDEYGYRRRSVDWLSVGLELPSPSGGRIRWLLRPADAARSSGIPSTGCP